MRETEADGREADAVHCRRALPDGNRAAASRARQKLTGGGRAMLRAAALATYARHGRHGFYGARYERRAERFLEGVPLDQGASDDGRRLTALTAGPDGREVSLTLHRSLRATREAVTRYRRTGEMDGFDGAVRLGVCQELTEALHQLVRGTEGVRIWVSWSQAEGPPEGTAARPAPVSFGPDDLPVLRQAGRRFVEREPAQRVRFTGAVVRLRRADPSGAGSVRLRVLAGVDVAQVRARLGERDYRTAVYAHLTGLPLSVAGTLESRGGFRRVADPRSVAPVPVGGASRARLLASLHSGCGAFEDELADGGGGGAGRAPPS